MTGEIERLLDETGWRLLSALQQQARLSYSELGQHVGLSAPAVSERVRKRVNLRKKSEKKPGGQASLPDTFWESQKRKAKRQPVFVFWNGKQCLKEARL